MFTSLKDLRQKKTFYVDFAFILFLEPISFAFSSNRPVIRAKVRFLKTN